MTASGVNTNIVLVIVSVSVHFVACTAKILLTFRCSISNVNGVCLGTGREIGLSFTYM